MGTTNDKYATPCFIQEAPVVSEIKPGTLIVKTSADGHPFCKFQAVMQTFGDANRMRRKYDPRNFENVIKNDPRINDLKKRNQWRGEWNHPNPTVKGQEFTSIRMAIPDPQVTSHFINNDYMSGMNYLADITTHPGTESGRAVASEIIDLKAIPAYSVRLLGRMIPNARPGDVNVDVQKVITFDWVDFPSHAGALGDIDHSKEYLQEAANVLFLKDLAKYAVSQSEVLTIICESFEITEDEIMGINNGNIIVQQGQSKIHLYPTEANIRREILGNLMGKGSLFK
jgi:hypothetical protein